MTSGPETEGGPEHLEPAGCSFQPPREAMSQRG